MDSICVNIFLFLIVYSQGAVVKEDVVSLPMVDDMKATLTANLDVSKLKNVLQSYVKEEIQSQMVASLNQSVFSVFQSMKELENQVQNYIEGYTKTLNKTISSHLLGINRGSDGVDDKIDDVIESLSQYTEKYAFQATLSESKEDLQSGTDIVFDVVKLNFGNCYDGKTGIFTAAVPGLYSFSWTTVSNAKRDFTSVLVKNGANIVANMVDSDSVPDAMTGSMSVVIEMEKGDRVWLEVLNIDGKQLRKEWRSVPCSVFSGFKI